MDFMKINIFKNVCDDYSECGCARGRDTHCMYCIEPKWKHIFINKIRIKWKIIGHFRFEFSYPYFIYVGFQHNKRFIIGCGFGYSEIIWAYKDWFIEIAPTISNGKAYRTSAINPKYKDEKLVCFSIPKQ